jgi:hypothetical protein
MVRTKNWSEEWTLSNWLGCFEDRAWRWRGAKPSDNKIVIEFDVEGHPYSIGELKCLLEKIGAVSVNML